MLARLKQWRRKEKRGREREREREEEEEEEEERENLFFALFVTTSTRETNWKEGGEELLFSSIPVVNYIPRSYRRAKRRE